eukprot:CAMPEP_0175113078 /NCGR_PEP_ID=MMETSP0086_2-20121207/15924_1 /TAXON_ID=136419 /ORGANISM="Unknown Unknown, Strain D1" /LENGTH=580 /DNA_ID=CAMNT_0016392223 /DNA_START=234 /DNA_END=1976 /DNA_ORIENTATION=+
MNSGFAAVFHQDRSIDICTPEGTIFNASNWNPSSSLDWVNGDKELASGFFQDSESLTQCKLWRISVNHAAGTVQLMIVDGNSESNSGTYRHKVGSATALKMSVCKVKLVEFSHRSFLLSLESETKKYAVTLTGQHLSVFRFSAFDQVRSVAQVGDFVFLSVFQASGGSCLMRKRANFQTPGSVSDTFANHNPTAAETPPSVSFSTTESNFSGLHNNVRTFRGPENLVRGSVQSTTAIPNEPVVAEPSVPFSVSGAFADSANVSSGSVLTRGAGQAGFTSGYSSSTATRGQLPAVGNQTGGNAEQKAAENSTYLQTSVLTIFNWNGPVRVVLENEFAVFFSGAYAIPVDLRSDNQGLQSLFDCYPAHINISMNRFAKYIQSPMFTHIEKVAKASFDESHSYLTVETENHKYCWTYPGGQLVDFQFRSASSSSSSSSSRSEERPLAQTGRFGFGSANSILREPDTPNVPSRIGSTSSNNQPDPQPNAVPSLVTEAEFVVDVSDGNEDNEEKEDVVQERQPHNDRFNNPTVRDEFMEFSDSDDGRASNSAASSDSETDDTAIGVLSRQAVRLIEDSVTELEEL